ncbi:MAG: LTA synthase family protein [Lachnospiraceae bacterium]
MKKTLRNDRPLMIKKCIAVFLILFGIFFVLSNKELYYSIHTERVNLKSEIRQDETLIEFSGDRTYEQQFQGWNGELRKVTIRFFNQGKINASGSVAVNILTEEGQVLQSSEKALTEISNSDKTVFTFKESSVLSEKKTYILQVLTKDAYNPQHFGIYTHIDKGNLFGELSQDGSPIEGRLRATFIYKYYNTAALRSMLILLFLALLFVLIPFGQIDYIIEKRTGKKIDSNILVSRLFFLATPILCILLGDRFNSYHLSEMFHRLFTIQALFNLIIYAMLWLIVYLLINRTQYTSIIVLLMVFFADIANYYVWIFRGCPILAADVQSATTAINVANNFSYTLDLTGIWGVVYIISFVSMLLSLKGYRGLRPGKRCAVAVACMASVLLFNGLFLDSDYAAKHVKQSMWNPQHTYAKNGNALSFVLSWASTRVEKPDGYSIEAVNKLTEQYPSDNASSDNAASSDDNLSVDTQENKTPNIIAIMDEALADLNDNGTIELSEDYLPFIHSLKENTIKGQLFVSIEGANTANSEFEFLTGDSMNFLPYRCIPYNEYIDSTTPSIAHTLKAQGYIGVNACHPFLGSGWSRSTAYPALGFNNFYDREYYKKNKNDQIVRNYISDEADFNQIIEDYESSKKESDNPFFLFNVTMQNHGAYTGKRGLVDTKIKIKDDTLYNYEAEQYINLAKLSDDAFKKLITYFKTVEEPTIIVMFGDHQPPISNSFYSAQFKKSVDKLSIKEKADWYSTPYIIWANYDIEEKNFDMSANYLSSYILNLAGAKLTGYNKFLLDLQKELPVISAVCYKDKDGNIYANNEKSKYSELLKSYQILQYNQLFDKENRADEFFFLKK